MDAFKNRKFTAVAVILALYLVQDTRVFAAYLNQIGPSPLRFSLATAIPMSFTLPAALVEPQKPTNATEIAVSASPSKNTNAIAVVPPPVLDTGTQPAVVSTEAPTTLSPTPSASELLVVSPQMLTEYFRPATEGTNSTSTVVVPTTSLPVGFNPPSVKAPSRATYSTP